MHRCKAEESQVSHQVNSDVNQRGTNDNHLPGVSNANITANVVKSSSLKLDYVAAQGQASKFNSTKKGAIA